MIGMSAAFSAVQNGVIHNFCCFVWQMIKADDIQGYQFIDLVFQHIGHGTGRYQHARTQESFSQKIFSVHLVCSIKRLKEPISAFDTTKVGGSLPPLP
jgi:hypothetical protein